MDQVFGGEPEYTGFRPPPAAQSATAADEENSRISPSALIGFAAIGIGLGIGLPKPRARWLFGAVTSGIALVAVVVNQVMAHERAQEALDQVESSFRSQLGNNPILGQSISTPVFEFEDEPGFWVVTVLLGLVVAYNVYEVVVLQRGPNQPRSAVGRRQPRCLPVSAAGVHNQHCPWMGARSATATTGPSTDRYVGRAPTPAAALARSAARVPAR